MYRYNDVPENTIWLASLKGEVFGGIHPFYVVAKKVTDSGFKRIYGYAMTSSERRKDDDNIIKIDPAFTGNRTDFSAIDISKITTLEPSELIKPIGKGNDQIFKRIQIVNKKFLNDKRLTSAEKKPIILKLREEVEEILQGGEVMINEEFLTEGKLTPDKRKRIETLVLEVIKRMDNPKMENYKRYQAMLKTMTDDEFETWANSMGHELDDTIQMFQLPFEEMKMTQIKSAAEYLGMPLEEYIWYRHNEPEGIRTKMRVPTGFVHIKRVQQLLAKKNRYAFDTEDITLKTGTVKGESKAASLTDPETFMLTALNADATLKEFLGPRADNQAAKQDMYRSIAKNGYVSLADLEDDLTRSTTINTMNVYLLGSGIRSDLITRGLKTAYSQQEELDNK
jgi:hypothetical protein